MYYRLAVKYLWYYFRAFSRRKRLVRETPATRDAIFINAKFRFVSIVSAQLSQFINKTSTNRIMLIRLTEVQRLFGRVKRSRSYFGDKAGSASSNVARS